MGKIKDLLIQYTDHVYDQIAPHINQDDPTVYDKCQDLVIMFASIKREMRRMPPGKLSAIYFDNAYFGVTTEFIRSVNLPKNALDFYDVYCMIDPAPFIDKYIR